MFKSIGLNIDHPETFFVQQGKITKIVNFKPNEVMEMLMESAGVAYYKEIAGQTRVVMKEKSEMLELAQERAKTNFGPKLKNLERDRAKANEFEAFKNELTGMTNLYNQAQRYHAVKIIAENTPQIAKDENLLHTLKSVKTQLLQELDQAKKSGEGLDENANHEIKELENRIKEQNPKIAAMTEKCNMSDNEVANIKARIKLKDDSVDSIIEKQKQAKLRLSTAQSQAEKFKECMSRLHNNLKDTRAELNDLKMKSISNLDTSAAAPIEKRVGQLENELNSLIDERESIKKQVIKITNSLSNGKKNQEEDEKTIKDLNNEIITLMQKTDSSGNLVGPF